MSKDDESNEDENEKIFQENFAPFHGRSKWVRNLSLNPHLT